MHRGKYRSKGVGGKKEKENGRKQESSKEGLGREGWERGGKGQKEYELLV